MPCVDVICLISLVIGFISQAWTFSTNQWLPYKIIIRTLHDPWTRLTYVIFACVDLRSGGVRVGTLIWSAIFRGVTRGGGGGLVAHPWKAWGEILEGRGKWWKRKQKGRERKKRRKGNREAREKGKWRGKRRENCGAKLKIKGGNV